MSVVPIWLCDSGSQYMQGLEVRSCHPGVGFPAACLHRACTPTAALEHLDKDSKKGSRGTKSQSQAPPNGIRRRRRRTPYYPPSGAPHCTSSRRTPKQQRGHVSYQRAIILLLLLSASPTSYSHHSTLGYRKQAREPHVMNVPFIPRDANFPLHVHDKRKQKRPPQRSDIKIVCLKERRWLPHNNEDPTRAVLPLVHTLLKQPLKSSRIWSSEKEKQKRT